LRRDAWRSVVAWVATQGIGKTNALAFHGGIVIISVDGKTYRAADHQPAFGWTRLAPGRIYRIVMTCRLTFGRR
jgi:hypothetical protein